MEMFDNFNNIPEGYIPDNRPKHCPCRKLDVITGETAVHTFEIPFDVTKECIDYSVTYKYWGDKKLVYGKDELEVEVLEDETSTITCRLNPVVTLLFGNTPLDTLVQLRFVMADRTVSFSQIYKIKVFNSIHGEIQPIPPAPGIIKGIGYTED